MSEPKVGMSPIEKEISELEERIKLAEVKNDPDTFAELMADDALLTNQQGQMFTKEDVLRAHRPAGEQKFSRFEVHDLQIQDHGTTVIVVCRIDLATRGFKGALRFTRVWIKLNGRWQIVAGHMSRVTT